jgi:peptidyl-tRNA hydrolase, PTH1 family
VSTDYLIVGQGNPGPEHAGQRHNVGFWVIDTLAKRHNVKVQAGGLFKRNAFTGRGRIGDAEFVLAKPQTFYNGTGRAVAQLMQKEHVPAANLIVVYDDLDLPEGRIRLRPTGTAGGNNGLKSIIGAIGTTEFGRIRVGVGRPWRAQMPTWDQDAVIDYLLSAPPRAGKEVLDAACERVADAIESIIRDGWERAMDTYNRKDPGEQG